MVRVDYGRLPPWDEGGIDGSRRREIQDVEEYLKVLRSKEFGTCCYGSKNKVVMGGQGSSWVISQESKVRKFGREFVRGWRSEVLFVFRLITVDPYLIANHNLKM